MKKLWKKMSIGCSTVLFNFFYKKYNGSIKGGIVERALMRFEADRVSEKQLSQFNAEQLDRYIKYLETWNKKLPTPVILEGDLNQYTTQDWLQVEKLLCKAQLASSTYRYNSEAYVHIQKSENLQLKAMYDLMWSAASWIVGVCLVSAYLQGLGLTNILRFAEVGQGWAGLAGVLYMLASMVGTTTLMTSFLQGQSMGEVTVRDLSATWEEVFQEKTLSDALLVGLLAEALNKIAIKDEDFIDFTTLAPRDVYLLLSTYGYFSTLNDKYKALVQKEVSSLESFQTTPSAYSPVKVPTSSVLPQVPKSQEAFEVSTRDTPTTTTKANRAI